MLANRLGTREFRTQPPSPGQHLDTVYASCVGPPITYVNHAIDSEKNTQ